MDNGRSNWAARQLLDRQIVDCNGIPAAKVDDLELVFTPEPDSLPIVSTILCGPAALARRFGGRLGSALETLHALVAHQREPAPASIPMGVVKEVGPSVVVSVPYKELPVNAVEEWLGEHLIAKIPGNGKRTGPAE
jgi:sporulation protein YlmC with PRC-barrel domain